MKTQDWARVDTRARIETKSTVQAVLDTLIWGGLTVLLSYMIFGLMYGIVIR